MKENRDFREFYKNEVKLGEGQFGCVYKVISKDSDEIRAIKVIEKNIIREAFKNKYFREPNQEEMKPYIDCFLNEIKKMEIAEGKNKANENAVKFYEYFNTPKEFAIVMELCDDNLLNYLLKVKEEEKYEIINQLNKTLKILVDNEIPYIDLKLENILIKFTEKSNYIIKLKMTDDIGLMKQFGKLFLFFNNNSENISCITPPEILEEEEYNKKSDLWSLGVIIYVLFFNKYPYKGKTNEEILDNIKKREEFEKSGNSELDNLIERLLVKEPKKRMGWEQYFNHPFFTNKIVKKFENTNYLDIYEIIGKIAETKIATIYKAKKKDNGELRAIKIFLKKEIKKKLQKDNLRIPEEEEIQQYIDTFNNEIKNLEIIEGKYNENINTVQFYEYYHNNDEFVIVMELCDDNLLNVFSKRNEPFNSYEIVNILRQLNNSFKIMVENKIVHRALNLDNILIKKKIGKSNPIIKLKITNDSCLLEDLSKMNHINKIQNILYFIAPEILMGEKYDEKCDLWSLGIIIFALAFKKYPFVGDNENDLLSQIKNIDEILKENKTKSDLDDLLQKLLIENPEKRLSWQEYFNHSCFREIKNIREKQKVKEFYEYNENDIIGESKFATIYKGKEKQTGQIRAIKIFNKEKVRLNLRKKKLNEPTEEDMRPFIESFNNEIKHMKIVEGKNKRNIYTVNFYEYFHKEDDDEFAVVMELCDETLLSLLQKTNPFTPRKINEILAQLNNSFKIMAENKLVHRALNLENILVKYDNEEKLEYIVKLKLTENSGILNNQNDISKMGEGFMDARFIAPEILKNEKYNEKCDLWSLGIIIYLLLFKEYPFKSKNPIQILKEVKSFEKDFPEKVEDSLLRDLLQKLLVEDPEKRITWKDYFNHPFFRGSQSDFREYYEIEKQLAKVQFAIIYQAKVKKNNELRAIKVFDINKVREYLKRQYIRPPTDEEMKIYIDSFNNEIKYMEIIEGKHKENNNTVKLYEYFQTENELATVMELCDDNFLKYFANRKEPFLSKEIYDILNQLNKSFKIMEENKLIHRALNLDNILLNYSKEEKTSYTIKLKLTDVCCLVSELHKINKSSKLTGDLTYIAPELLKREDYNQECDLWSIGVIIYVLYFREYPFPGDNEYEILDNIKKGIDKNKKTDNSDLDDLIQKLLVVDPTLRLTWTEYFAHPFFSK